MDVVEKLPRHVAELLSIAAAWELDEEDDGRFLGSEGIKAVTLIALNKEAGQRNIDRFGPKNS